MATGLIQSGFVTQNDQRERYPTRDLPDRREMGFNATVIQLYFYWLKLPSYLCPLFVGDSTIVFLSSHILSHIQQDKKKGTYKATQCPYEVNLQNLKYEFNARLGFWQMENAIKGSGKLIPRQRFASVLS